MKIGRKFNLLGMLILYFFLFFSVVFTINILFKYFRTSTLSLEFNQIYSSLGYALFFWIFYLINGKLIKTINNSYDQND